MRVSNGKLPAGSANVLINVRAHRFTEGEVISVGLLEKLDETVGVWSPFELSSVWDTVTDPFYADGDAHRSFMRQAYHFEFDVQFYNFMPVSLEDDQALPCQVRWSMMDAVNSHAMTMLESEVDYFLDQGTGSGFLPRNEVSFLTYWLYENGEWSDIFNMDRPLIASE